mgnify:CR=1 FL=1
MRLRSSLREAELRRGLTYPVVVLIGAVMVIVWQQISPSSRAVFGLTELSGYIEKLVYVTALLSLMFVCGAVQLTGCCSRCLPGVSTSPESEDSGAA